MDTEKLGIGELWLDTLNPRHEPVRAQGEAIAAIISEQGPKLVALMKDIAEYGMSPIDKMFVIEGTKPHKYIVVEGNRRIAALKLLDNPDLASGAPIERQVRRAARDRKVITKEVECVVAPSRSAARHWIILRHRGEADGAGTVRWHARQAARFEVDPGSQAAKALDFLDAVAAGYPGDDALNELAEQVASERITTLGRLVGDPDFRSRGEFAEDNGELKFHHPAEAMRPFIEKLLSDLSSGMTVTSLKKKPQRLAYFAKLPALDRSTRRAVPAPLGTHPPTPDKDTSEPDSSRPARVRRQPLFKGLKLDNLGTRVPALLREIQKVKVDDLPNAAAVLTRVLLEISVDHAIEKNGWPRSQEFRLRLRSTLKRVDPTEKDNRFAALRTGLSDGTSLYGVNTLHAYMHNPHLHPTGTEIRAIAANMADFLRALDDIA